MEKEHLRVNIVNEGLVDSYFEAKHLSVNSYTDLPDLPFFPLSDGEPITVEHDAEHELYCGKIISTYPVQDNRRLGDPVKDVFQMRIWQNRIIAAVADGCGHGTRPYEAALDAVTKFKDYLTSRKEIVHDVREVGRLLLRAFCEGNNKIVENKEEVWDAGSTTLLGAVLAEMPKSTWALTLANVGNSKAFVYRKSADVVVDVTADNCCNPAWRDNYVGRLGPYLKHGLPDLRNLKLYFTQCSAGDMVILMSDGVWMNLDPEIQGRSPAYCRSVTDPDVQMCEADVDADLAWTDLSPERSYNMKTKYCERMVLRMVQQGHDSPTLLTRELLRHCEALTRPLRQFMQDNPYTAPPQDYTAYPGAMDHSTALVFKVPPNACYDPDH